jgi:SAM-dependent methyltransferase
VTYDPRSFWEDRLREHFDLRGTGETGLSLEYNRACYTLRRETLDRVLADAHFDPRDRRVLDVGCGTGFFSAYYLSRGARLTGLDIAPVSIERLSRRHPEARFQLADVSEAPIVERYDLVNAFDVLYHIVDDARWERAVRHLGGAVEAGGLLILTDTFASSGTLASHNRMRPLSAYAAILEPLGFRLGTPRPDHVLLNRELGVFRFLNRMPGLLLAADRILLGLGFGRDPATSKLLVAARGR